MVNDLNRLLLDKRTKLGFSQQQVADEVKISRQFYGMIEKGERRPSVEVAKKIAQTLSFDWQIFFESKCNRKLHREVG